MDAGFDELHHVPTAETSIMNMFIHQMAEGQTEQTICTEIKLCSLLMNIHYVNHYAAY